MVKRYRVSNGLITGGQTMFDLVNLDVVLASDYAALEENYSFSVAAHDEATQEVIALTARCQELNDKWAAENAQLRQRNSELETALRRLDDELTVEEVDPDDCRDKCLQILDEIFHYTKTHAETACDAVHAPGAVCPKCGHVDNSRMNTAKTKG